MRHAARIPGDLCEAEIERRYALALLDVRRGGTGDIARTTEPEPLRTAAVLALVAEQPATIGHLAMRLKKPKEQVWGHVCYLRKCQQVEVKHWITSAKGRRLAVYGVTSA